MTRHPRAGAPDERPPHREPFPPPARRAGTWAVAAWVVAAPVVVAVVAVPVVAALVATVLPVPPTSPVPRVARLVAGTLLFATGGAGAGVVARVVLGRIRRGARVRAPVCEVALAAVWAAAGAAWLAGALSGVRLPVLLGLAWLAVAASAVDVLHRRLPDALTLPAFPAALLLVLPLGPDALGRAVAGSVVAAAAHGGVHLVAPRTLGAGDVKLAGPLGAVLAASSWPAVGLAAGLASLLSVGVALATVAAGRTGPAGAVPHGPSMLLATWLVVAGAALGAGAG